MKGDAVTEVLWTIGLSLLIFLMMFVIVPRVWKDMAKTIALFSPNIAIRDLAGLITVSGAAPNNIIISYEIPTETYSYNLEIKDRELTLEMLGETKEIKGVVEKTSDEIPVDLEASISDTTIFNIKKTRIDDKNVYEVYP